MDWLILLILVGGYLVTLRYVYSFALNHMIYGEPDAGDKALCTFAAMFFSLGWPFIAVGWGIWALLLRGVKTDDQRQAEREEEQREQAKELDRLRKLAKEYNLPGYKEM